MEDVVKNWKYFEYFCFIYKRYLGSFRSNIIFLRLNIFLNGGLYWVDMEN